MTPQQIQTELAAIQREQYALAERIAAFVKRIDIPVNNPVVERQNPNYAASDTPGQTIDYSEWQRREEFKYPSITNGSGPDSPYAKTLRNKLMKPKDYEIIAFRATEKSGRGAGEIRKVHPESLDNFLNGEYSLRSGHWEIYQVKRSDGSLWTVGETISHLHSDDPITIDNFTIDNCELYANRNKNESNWALCEYWRKPTAPDWEIVELIGTDQNEICNGKIHKVCPEFTDVNSYLSTGAWAIHAVRRKDGEVFRVGDVVENKNHPGTYGAITMFSAGSASWERGVMYARFIDNEGASCCKELCNIEHYKPRQTFVTADNITVKEGDTIYFRLGGEAIECKAIKGLNWANHYSTREAAERGPVLFVTVDGVEVHDPEDAVYWIDKGGYIKSCVAKRYDKSGEPVYSTHTAALAAYEAWLYDQPVLSLNDIKGQPPQILVDIVKQKMKNR